MSTQEIPREQWPSFFEVFSLQHEGWLATLEVLDLDIGAQQETRELPLEGVSVDSEDDEGEAIVISLGRTRADHITHTIVEPEHVWLEQTAEGADAALEIEASDESKALLRFRSPKLPEFVDGVVSDQRF